MKKTAILFLLVLSMFVSQLLFPQIAFFNSHAVYADTQDVEIDLTQYLVLSDGQKVSDVFNTPSSMINLLVKVVFVGVGLILLVLIVISGLSMIAGGTSDNKEKAKSTMTSALMGFLIIFAAYWIMQIIKIFTGADIGF